MYVIYWHKMANSGLLKVKTYKDALSEAKLLANQIGMYDVVIIEGKMIRNIPPKRTSSI